MIIGNEIFDFERNENATKYKKVKELTSAERKTAFVFE